MLDCYVGKRPSYAWRDIVHGRELLKQGLIKSIGNGKGTWVWSENWILDGRPGPPMCRQRDRNIMLRVSDLMNSQTRTWEESTIHNLFIEKDANHIMKMKIFTHLEDTWMWGFSKNGAYDSQSGYRLLEKLPEPQEEPPEPMPPIEKALWKIKTSSKIKYFLWRALSGVLAVSELTS